MSSPRKINDHSFWAGGKSAGCVFPMGAKLKSESSASEAGAVSKYDDTTEDIKSQQDMAAAKAKAHPMKSGYRN